MLVRARVAIVGRALSGVLVAFLAIGATQSATAAIASACSASVSANVAPRVGEKAAAAAGAIVDSSTSQTRGVNRARLVPTLLQPGLGELIVRRQGNDHGAALDGRVKGAVVVSFESGMGLQAFSSARERGALLKRHAKTGGFFVVYAPEGVSAAEFAASLQGAEGVRHAEPDSIVRALLVPDDPNYLSQWGLQRIDVPAAWDVTMGSPSVTIAIVDTGVRLNHPDLVGRLDTVNDYDFVNHDSFADDDQGHGTHCAGIAAASTNNGLQVAGIAGQCTILPVKVLGSDGNGTDSDAADGIRWAADQGADVMSLSLGTPEYSPVIDDAIQYAIAKDCVVVAAAGNDSSYGISYPARNANVLAIGSTTSADERSYFSNYGPDLDLCAPGSSILSTTGDGGIGYMSGTSMAAPHAAGVVALVRSADPSLTRVEVEQRLRSTALDLGSPGHDNFFGDGLIQAAAASGTPVPTNTPPVLAPIGAKAIDELSTLSFSAAAFDSDVPANRLSFGLEGAPAGASINPATGSFTWTPVEAQGPDSYSVTISVSDGRGGADSETITVTVAEVNIAPVLTPIGNRSVAELSGLFFSATAMDSDVPARALSFSLGAGAPSGASITSGGVFTWTPTEPQGPGTHDVTIIVSDGTTTDSETITVTVLGVANELVVTSVAGADRVSTAAEASRIAFPRGAVHVVVATGENWPDALGGSALAGAVGGPLLLTLPTTLPAATAAEISRLGATQAFILGGGGAVGWGVQNALAHMGLTVERIQGADRYETAACVADRVIQILGAGYTGDAFVATGVAFPDATAAAPLADALGRPILLANPASGAVYVPSLTAQVTILGGAGAVPTSVESALGARLGSWNVTRLGGANRYATAALIAQAGVAAGMSWDGVGLASGANFPDALSGGAMLGERNSVMLLTSPTTLSSEAYIELSNNREAISTLFIFGGSGAVSTTVEDTVRGLLGS